MIGGLSAGFPLRLLTTYGTCDEKQVRLYKECILPLYHVWHSL